MVLGAAGQPYGGGYGCALSPVLRATPEGGIAKGTASEQSLIHEFQSNQTACAPPHGTIRCHYWVSHGKRNRSIMAI